MHAVLGFSSLRLLDLSGCGLDEWSQVGAYGLLPGLRELVLDSNPLSCVDPPSDGHFHALRRFSLTATRYPSISFLSTTAFLSILIEMTVLVSDPPLIVWLRGTTWTCWRHIPN